MRRLLPSHTSGEPPISIHAPRVGCDQRRPPTLPRRQRFQSTHPVWGATTIWSGWTQSSPDFNPRTPCGVRPMIEAMDEYYSLFQSTHPVWGATRHFQRVGPCFPEFQSTHPVWGATRGRGYQRQAYPISIHAPRVGCDRPHRTASPGPSDFNPRTPCGVRLSRSGLIDQLEYISIHAPRVGCDSWTRVSAASIPNFNPRTPCGVRPAASYSFPRSV